MKNFAIIGVGGYIAPRHIKAINDVGGRVVCATDVQDSVGILDKFTQDVAFFTDFERFEVFTESLKGTDKEIDYVTICSPNYLHFSHIKFALRHGCDVICEKPIVLTTKEIDQLLEFEKESGKRVYCVLQLRVHDEIIKLRDNVKEGLGKNKHDIDLTYLTSRGPWYHESWKGELKKSGGLPSNIGVHFYDMLTWIFGDVVHSELHVSNDLLASGFLELECAHVKWILSVDRKYLPRESVEKGLTTFRCISVDGKEIEFSGGFTDLHTKVYQDVLAGKGYGLRDAYTAIKIVEDIRGAKELGVVENSHQLLKEAFSG